MAIRNLRYQGDEILKKKSREVPEEDIVTEKIQTLIDDMIETMHKYNGVGLAAVQVGVLKRIVVIDLYDDHGPIVLINPVIVKTKGEQEVDEGCLSFPNEFAKVVRPAEVVAEYMDRNGKRMRVKAKELLAQAISHELDHLEGELFIDKIQNRYRWRIIIKGNMTEKSNQILNDCLKEIYQENIKDTRIAIDINPNNMS